MGCCCFKSENQQQESLDTETSLNEHLTDGRQFESPEPNAKPQPTYLTPKFKSPTVSFVDSRVFISTQELSDREIQADSEVSDAEIDSDEENKSNKDNDENEDKDVPISQLIKEWIDTDWIDTDSIEVTSIHEDELDTNKPIKEIQTSSDILKDSGIPVENKEVNFGAVCSLGTGSYGDVIEVQEQSTNDHQAMKGVDIGRNALHHLAIQRLNINEIKQARRQMEGTQNLKNIFTNIFDVFYSDCSIKYVIELCRGGDLWCYLKCVDNARIDRLEICQKLDDEDITEQESFKLHKRLAGQPKSVANIADHSFVGIGEKKTKVIVKQILLYLQHIHAAKLVVKDLKLENILIQEDGTLRIGDLMTVCHVEMDQNVQSLEDLIEDGQPTGSPLYMPPEQLEGWFCQKSDMWVVGVMTFQLLTLITPFQKEGESDSQTGSYDPSFGQELVDEGKLRDQLRGLDHQVSDVAIDFICCLMTIEAKDRMSAADALEHVFIKDVNNNDINDAVIERDYIPFYQRQLK